MFTEKIINRTCMPLFKGRSFLIFWPEESAVSVVNARKITDPEPDSLQLQQDCKVKVGRNIYSGRVAAIGKYYVIAASCCMQCLHVHVVP